MTTATIDLTSVTEVFDASKADTREFNPGDQVRIINPNCDEGWRTIATVTRVGDDLPGILSIFGADSHVAATPNDGPHAGQEGVFAKAHLELVEGSAPTPDAIAPGAITVDDEDGLRSLPIGAIIRDTVGDELTKDGKGWYYSRIGRSTFDAEGACFYPSSIVASDSIDKPWVVVTSLDVEGPAFEAGDRVLVMEGHVNTGYPLWFGYFDPDGEPGVVEEVIAGSWPSFGPWEFVVKVDGREDTKYTSVAQLSPLPGSEPESYKFQTGDIVTLAGYGDVRYEVREPEDSDGDIYVREEGGDIWDELYAQTTEATLVQTAAEVEAAKAQAIADADAVFVFDVEGYEALPFGSVTRDAEDNCLAVRVRGGYVRPEGHFSSEESDIYPCEYMDIHGPQRVLFMPTAA